MLKSLVNLELIGDCVIICSIYSYKEFKAGRMGWEAIICDDIA